VWYYKGPVRSPPPGSPAGSSRVVRGRQQQSATNTGTKRQQLPPIQSSGSQSPTRSATKGQHVTFAFPGASAGSSGVGFPPIAPFPGQQQADQLLTRGGAGRASGGSLSVPKPYQLLQGAADEFGASEGLCICAVKTDKDVKLNEGNIAKVSLHHRTYCS
jgi:hypothetical protein